MNKLIDIIPSPSYSIKDLFFKIIRNTVPASKGLKDRAKGHHNQKAKFLSP